jgi:cell wall-associated NlpC family hydrolase
MWRGRLRGPVLQFAMLAFLAVLAGCAGAPRRPAPQPLPPQVAAQVVFTALNFIDVPYRRGGGLRHGSNAGSSGGSDGDKDPPPDGFDCSSFTRHIFERSLGVALPRTAWDQARDPSLAEVAASDLQPGDLVFFNTLQRPHSHVGIYIGEGRFVHAPRTGALVRLEDMQARYWVQRFDGARRAAQTGGGASPLPSPRLSPL